MFYEENYTYKRIDKSDYDEFIDLYEGEEEIKGTIYSFYEDEQKNIHKLIDLKLPGEKWNLISKYYVISMELESDMPLITQKLLHIVNLGYFIVTGPFYFDTFEDKVIFDNYDKEFRNLTFEFTDDEFLKNNNYFNQVKIYQNGEILNYNDKLFYDYLEEQKDNINFIDFEYILIYAYKGKALRFLGHKTIDEIINSGNDYNKEIYDILVEKESNTGVVYKKNKDKYEMIFKIGY